MIKRFQAIKLEGVFFYSCLIASLLVAIFNPANPTIDGPSHLYNARVINYLIGGNSFLSNYYTLNKIPVPNLTDHYLLALFMSIFSWQTAEKLLQVIYLLGFSLLFRALIRQWKDSNIGLSIFAIPFSFSIFYYSGFYNACLSFPLLFGTIIYYKKYISGEDKLPSLKKYLILCVLLTLVYFTNGLAFLFAGLGLFFFELPYLTGIFSIEQREQPNIKRLVGFLIVCFPGLIYFLIFLRKVSVNPTDLGISPADLVNRIYYVQPLLNYAGSGYRYTNYALFAVILALYSATYYRIKYNSSFKQSDIFLVLCFVAFLCFWFIPDEASVGMMSMRFCNYFFIFLLIWIALQQGSKVITWFVSTAMIIIHFTLLFKVHQPLISELNKEVEMVRNAGNAIEPNSIVLVVDNTNNFSYLHFADYLGVDKPLVIIGNYEANRGWFATTWNNNIMPDITIGGKDSIPPYLNVHWKTSAKTKAIDYVFVYGDYSDLLQKSEWKPMDEILQKDYKLHFTSADSRIHVFSLR